MAKIDLHTHTTASDGIYSPSDLIDLAISNNLTAMAITDHDSVDGLEEAMNYSKGKDLELIPGIEFSIEYTGGSFHLIGLYIDFYNSELIETTERLKKLRSERVVMIVEDLNRYGIDISIDDISSLASGYSVGRPHIARVLVEKGYASDVNAIFQHYMVKGKPGYVKKEKILVDKAINIIKQAGGISIIAHPITLNFKTFDNFEKQVQQLAVLGLDGIEVFSSMHTHDEIDEFERITHKFNLIISGGSDFHGDKGKELGIYIDGEPIPPDILKDIEKYRLLYCSM